MNKIEKIKFLLNKFDVNKEDIENFFKNKQLKEKFGNTYITENDEFNSQDLVLINLKKELVSKYFLGYILKHSKNKLKMINVKRALDFTYGKDLHIDGIRGKIEINKYYLLLLNGQILGYVEKNGNKLKNLMNIGDYLRE